MEGVTLSPGKSCCPSAHVHLRALLALFCPHPWRLNMLGSVAQALGCILETISFTLVLQSPFGPPLHAKVAQGPFQPPS